MRTLALIALLFVPQATPVTQAAGTLTGQLHSANASSVAGIRVTAMAVPQPGVGAFSDNVLERLTTTDSDGRYRLEDVAPGRYYITAGLLDQPTYYPGVRTLAEARMVTVVANSSQSGLDITLVQPTGVRVSGQVKGLPGPIPDGFVRVTLVATTAAQRGGQPIEALVSSNGIFEFQKILPGLYNVRTSPLILGPPGARGGPPMLQIEVKDTDTSIELTAGPMIVGQVTVDDGSRPPVLMNPSNAGILNPTPLPPNAMIASAVQLIGVQNTGTASPTPFGSVRADGAVLVPNFPAGEYRIAARLPFGYSIKSISLGDTDLLRTTLKISDAASATGNLRVVLTTATLPNAKPGVKVSGRVTGSALPPNSWIRMNSGSGFMAEGNVGETLVRPDGTFELNRVPAGVYGVQVLPPQGMAPQIAIVVEDIDVRNVEVPNGGTPPATVGVGSSPATGASQFPGLPPVLAIQPPSYPPGVRVSGRVISTPGTSAADGPKTVVFFGPRDGLSVKSPIRADGTFELEHVEAGDYDARTLPLSLPPVSTRVVVGIQDMTGITVASR